MISNWFKLYTDTTQFIFVGLKQQLAKVNCNIICLGNVTIPFLSKVTYLGIILDDELTMVQHVHGITSHCFYQPRQIRAVLKSLNIETTKQFMHLCTADWTIAIVLPRRSCSTSPKASVDP